MANEDHLVILKGGVKAWNEWRKQRPYLHPDLCAADLRGMNLGGVDFGEAEVRSANLQGVNLVGADLRGANLRQANLSGAILIGADLSSGFYPTDLREADLSFADLRQADFSDAYLTEANVSKAILRHTRFEHSDLSQLKGLDTAQHDGPSKVSIDTIYLSKGKIPEVFLRGAGVPEPFIANMKAFVAAMEPIQFYSCFISYSSKDQEFADRLHADLQQKQVRCWFAPEDLKIGDKFRTQIDEAIRIHDKLLLVLTESSVKSEWVEKEAETAFEKERKQGRAVLFPIRLDDAVMEAEEAWAADIRRTRHIADFCGWKEHEKYKKAFERLMRDLKAQDESESRKREN